MTDTDAIIRDRTGQARGLIEFKHCVIRAIDLNSWQLGALRSDAKALQVPLFVVVYYHLDARYIPLNDRDYQPSTTNGDSATSDEILNQIAHRQYLVIAGNPLAKQALGTTQRMLSANEYTQLNAKLTGIQPRASYSTDIIEWVDTPTIQGALN